MKSLSGRTETLMLEKHGRLVRSKWVSLPGDTISNSKGLVSRQCLASDSIKSPARSKSPRRWILRKARGRMAWRTSENIVLVVSENTCGVWSLPHQLLEDGYHRPTASERPIGARAADRPLAAKNDAGPTGPATQTGRLHVWETWDHEDPEFRTRSAETARVEDLKPTYPSADVLVGGEIRTLAG